MLLDTIEYKTQPWKHQHAAVQFALRKSGCMLAMDMGTGKSLVAIALCNNRTHKRVLIVCPKSVIPVWPSEFAKHSAREYAVLALTKGTVKVKTLKAVDHLAKFERAVIVINHESAWRNPFGSWAKSAGLDIIICDELHRGKAVGGKFSWWLKNIRQHIPRRLGLTGTPMPHSPLDIYAQYRFLDPSIYGYSYKVFRKRYAVLQKQFFGARTVDTVVGYQNLDELNEKFYSIAFRADKSVLDLPPEHTITRRCDLEPSARRVYSALENSFKAHIESGEVTPANALVKLLRLQQVTSGHITTDDGDSENVSTAKAELLKDIFEDLAPHEPIIVFARFRRDLDTIKAMCAKTDRTCLELSGRRNQLQEWQDEQADVLAVQIQAGGVGIDLTRARYGIYYSLGFSLGDLEQSKARLHRPGQERPVTYINLIANGTIDEAVVGALAKRKDLVDGVLEFLGRKEPVSVVDGMETPW